MKMPRALGLAVLLIAAPSLVLSPTTAGALAGNSPNTRYLLSAANHPGDTVGRSVALSGNTAVVGAPGHCAVYVYQRHHGIWHLRQTLIDNTGVDFGWAVAISGNILVAGSSGYATDVFAYSQGSWHRQARLQPPTSSTSFGSSVAIAGSTVLVGDPGVTVGGAQDAGAVYLYTRSRQAWHMLHVIDDPYPHRRSEDEFGYSVAASGTTAIVGSFPINRTSDDAFVYAATRGTWSRQATLTDRGLGFGWSVAASGATLVVGAFADGAVTQGLTYVYAQKTVAWPQMAKLIDPHGTNGDSFGYAVAISGDRIVVGAPHKSQHRCGTAFEYLRTRAKWHEKATVVNPRCSRNDRFGAAVALSGRTAIIGAPGKDNNSGAVYVISLP